MTSESSEEEEMTERNRRITPATILAGIAIFATLGGGAVALSGERSAKAKRVTKSLNLKNGWERWSTETAKPAVVKDASGIVHFKGVIAQPSGTEPVVFRLPKAFRPKHEVRVLVQLFNLEVGELDILPSGQTTVVPNGSDAKAFTSMDGASFVP
jgi:hypothetical protein